MTSIDALQAELHALRQRIAELKVVRALLESASQGIVVDLRGDIVLVNARLEAMFGYRREELLGQKLEVLGLLRAHAYPVMRSVRRRSQAEASSAIVYETAIEIASAPVTSGRRARPSASS